MKIILTTDYKSLTPFETEELPKLTILTGKNGSGKSHLLELLYCKTKNPNKNFKIPPEASKLKIEGYDVKKIKHSKFGQIHTSPFASGNEDTVKAIKNRLKQHLKKFNVSNIPQQSPNQEQQTEDYFTLNKICQNLGKEHHELTDTDILNYHFSLSDFEHKDIFRVNLTHLIVTYFERKLENMLKKTASTEFNESGFDYLPVNEFDEKYPDPFKEINDILNISRVDYELKSFSLNEYFKSKSYTPTFVHKLTGIPVSVSDFSSGEQVLLSLAFSILNIEKHEAEDLPNLLLLDELDASLHPSMIKNLLEVIQNYLIKKKDIRIILTSHNPTTVALAPEDNIYLFKKASEASDGKRFIKIDKKLAIKELLDGIKAIDILPENRRQIFVESLTDAKFYETVYSSIKAASALNDEIYLNFIPSGVENGDVNLVVATVKKLREAGNDKIFGLIDWDLQNKESDNGVKVNGINEFYSLENIVLNPLYLGLFLIDKCNMSFSDFGINISGHWLSSISSFSVVEIESFINSVEQKIHQKISQKEQVEIPLHSGFSVKFNKAILEYNGHDYESVCRQVFPQLNQYAGKKLLHQVIQSIIRHTPQFLPNSVVKNMEYFNS